MSLCCKERTVFLNALMTMVIASSPIQAHELGYGKTFTDIQNQRMSILPSHPEVDFSKLQHELQRVLEQSKILSTRIRQYDILLETGKRQLEEGENDRALSSFAAAQRMIPVLPDSYRWIGEALFKQAQYFHAEKFALHFVAIAPSEQSAVGWRLLGDIYHKRREAELMLACYRNLLLSQGQLKLQHWLSVASTLRSFQYYQDSLDSLNRGLAQYPTNAKLIKLKIQVLREQGNTAYANLIAWHWLSFDIGSSEAWRELAMTQRASGAIEFERDSLRQALSPAQSAVSQNF